MTLNENEEKASIDELRRRMKGKMTQEMYEDDSLFCRFLRARNYDMDAAETMLTNNVNWRKTNNVDLLTTPAYIPPEVCLKYIHPTRTGYYKDGTPLIYTHFGTYDTRGVLKSVRKADMVNYLVYLVEDLLKGMKEHNEKIGKKADQLVFIFNLEQMSLSVATHKLTLETVITFFVAYDANYPERLKAAYIINAPFCFTLAWTLIKPFLSGNTINKIHIFGKDGWQEEFQKNVEPDVIPAMLGGNLTDPDGDPMCKTMICYGGHIPESYYASKSTTSLFSSTAKKLSISRLSKAEVKLEVMYPGSTIEWEFDVKSKDIAFSLLHKVGNSNPDSDYKELIPKHRVETGISLEVGIYTVDKAGTYILEFDNTYSWMHSKEIHYKTSITRPQNNSSLIK